MCVADVADAAHRRKGDGTVALWLTAQCPYTRRVYVMRATAAGGDAAAPPRVQMQAWDAVLDGSCARLPGPEACRVLDCPTQLVLLDSKVAGHRRALTLRALAHVPEADLPRVAVLVDDPITRCEYAVRLPWGGRPSSWDPIRHANTYHVVRAFVVRRAGDVPDTLATCDLVRPEWGARCVDAVRALRAACQGIRAMPAAAPAPLPPPRPVSDMCDALMALVASSLADVARLAQELGVSADGARLHDAAVVCVMLGAPAAAAYLTAHARRAPPADGGVQLCAPPAAPALVDALADVVRFLSPKTQLLGLRELQALPDCRAHMERIAAMVRSGAVAWPRECGRLADWHSTMLPVVQYLLFRHGFTHRAHVAWTRFVVLLDELVKPPPADVGRLCARIEARIASARARAVLYTI